MMIFPSKEFYFERGYRLEEEECGGNVLMKSLSGVVDILVFNLEQGTGAIKPPVFGEDIEVSIYEHEAYIGSVMLKLDDKEYAERILDNVLSGIEKSFVS